MENNVLKSNFDKRFAKLTQDSGTENVFVEAIKETMQGVQSLTHFLSSLAMLYKQIVSERIAALGSKHKVSKIECQSRLEALLFDLKKKKAAMNSIQVAYFESCDAFETLKQGWKSEAERLKTKPQLQALKLKKRSLDHSYRVEYVSSIGCFERTLESSF